VAVALIGLVGRRLRDAMRRIESLSSPGVLLGIRRRVTDAIVVITRDKVRACPMREQPLKAMAQQTVVCPGGAG